VTEDSNAQPLLKSVAKEKGCDAKTLAVIAAHFIALGDTEQEALKKANALYLRACTYAKEFASLPPTQKAIEAFGEEALAELVESEDLAIGDSEVNSQALKHFRQTATTKLDRHITHKKFVEIVRDYAPERVEEIEPSGKTIEKIKTPSRLAPSVIEHLHKRLRDSRSGARAKRRKSPSKEIE
jgi:hypothetical protein